MNEQSQEKLLYGDLTARIRRMLEPVAHDSFLFFEDTMKLIQPQIPAGCKIFDAGCGRGTITARLAEMGCTVIAIDSNPLHIRQTSESIREKHLESRVQVEVSNLPDSFPQDHFDVILDCFSWWHISDWGRLFNLSKKNLSPHGKLVILDTFFGWKTTLDFRQEMRALWQTALPTFNECRNMLIKREFRILESDPLQEAYIRYLDALCGKIHELEKEDLGTGDPIELQNLKVMWEWFRSAAHQEELVATMIVGELTES